MVLSKKNIGGWEGHTRFGGVRRGGLRNGALIFIVTVYVNSTFHHPLVAHRKLKRNMARL